jgi:hypothetical protein
MKKQKNYNFASKCRIVYYSLFIWYWFACSVAIAQSNSNENFLPTAPFQAKQLQENIELKFFDDIDELNKELITKLGTQANLWYIRSSYPQGKFLNNSLWNGARWEPTESYTAVKISRVQSDLGTNSINEEEADLTNNNYILDLRKKCNFDEVELKDNILSLSFKNLDLITINKTSIKKEVLKKQYNSTGNNNLKITLVITPNQLNIFEIIPKCKNYLGFKKYIVINAV